jgi:hypothetical protein
VSIGFASLSLFSLLYLASVLTFVLSLNEQSTWEGIRRQTIRRWIKLVGALVGIGAVTWGLTTLSSLM